VAFTLATRKERAVLVRDDEIYDLERHSDGRFSSDSMQALARFGELHDVAAGLAAPADETLDRASLGTCVPRPRKVFGIGLNYRTHAQESGMELPPSPLVFSKFTNCLVGADDDIVLYGPTTDWEAELVVVMGSHARDISAAEAWQHVAGLTCGQDISERTVQFASKPPHFDLGKSYDTYGPIGPWVVSIDQFADPADLAIGCAVNGETKQAARTDDLIFSIPELIAYISAICTLEPGDLIFTGTPSGVGVMSGTFLQPGDVLTTTIEGIGSMTNRCVAK
jgi:2-keto-4-pentenoate hydratase/2-oxohepta-3-ene-1,7-dioic acid hydratase in catechol pathway